MMNEESLKTWEQDHIELLTSSEMGEWLHRRDNRRDMNERPQGEWVFTPAVTCAGYYKCNKCGELEQVEMNFCPNCGARMRGKEGSSTKSALMNSINYGFAEEDD